MGCRSSLRIALLSAASWLGATTLGFAGPLLEAHVTKIINVVNVVEPARGSHPASLNELIKNELALKTGVKSRSELRFQDNTLTRIGPETYFSFKTGTRDMTLEQGTLLLQVPKGIGGAKIRTAAVTASITGTTIMMEYRPGRDLKVLVLEGSMRLSLSGSLGEQILLRPGQMIMMPPDAKRIPQPVHVDLKHVMSTSSLVHMSKKGTAPLPSLSLIQKAIEEQAVEKSNNTLVATNLAIEGQGTDVVVAPDSVIAALNRHDSATSAGKPEPTPVPVPSPVATPQPTPVSGPSPLPSPVATPSPLPSPVATPDPFPSPTPTSSGSPLPSATPNPNPSATPGDDNDDNDGEHKKKDKMEKHGEHAPQPNSPPGERENSSSAIKSSAQAESQASTGAKSATRLARPSGVNRDGVIHLESSEQLVSLMETSTNSSGGKVRVQLPVRGDRANSSNPNFAPPATRHGAEPARLPGKNSTTEVSSTVPARMHPSLSP